MVSEDQPIEEDLEFNEEDEEDKEPSIPDFFDQDPTWDPEAIDSEFDKIRNEDDSANTYNTYKLVLLFQFCHLCLFPKPNVAVTQTGTMLTIVSECSNCGESYTWKSQPDLMGRFPAGNLLLSFATLCAGASIRKVLLVF